MPKPVDNVSMNLDDTALEQPQVDERFVDEWIRFGISELEAYLQNYARFDAFCTRRDTPLPG
jgi:hypothetical protein